MATTQLGSVNTTEVKLLGQKIVLKSSENDPALVQEVIQMVSLLLNETEARCKGAVPHQIALLALLDLAEGYVKAKRRTAEFKSQLEEKSNRLVNLVEAEFM